VDGRSVSLLQRSTGESAGKVHRREMNSASPWRPGGLRDGVVGGLGSDGDHRKSGASLLQEAVRESARESSKKVHRKLRNLASLRGPGLSQWRG